LIKIFAEPSREYAPTPFFALNSELAPQALVSALSEIAKAGMAGVFLHPRSGLELDYLSEKFFERVGLAIETCSQLGLKAWLYDEYNWPSGVAGGKLLLDHPEFRQSYLDYVSFKNPSAGKAVNLPGPAVAAFAVDAGVEFLRGLSGPRIFLPGVRGEVLVFYEAQCRDRMFVNSCADWVKPSPGYLELMNPEATAEFIRLTHEQYARRFSAHFGKTIPGVFTDEPQQYDGYPWSKLFRERFHAEHGYDPGERLYLLALDLEGSIKFRTQYYGLAGRMMDEGYYARLGRWCREHGLILTGHLGMEERITQVAVNHGGLCGHLSEMQMPGMDALNVGEGISGGLGNMEAPNFAAKMASSVALAAGARRVLSETGGGAGWQMTLWEYKRMCDWLFAAGVNFINPHHSLLSIKGLRKRDFPPSHFFPEPWFEYYGEFSRYVSRVCRWLSEGERWSEFAVLIPSSSFQAQSRGRGRKTEELEQLSAQIEELSRIFMQSQREFDYLFEESLSAGKAKVEQGRINFAGQSYAALIVPCAKVLHQDALSLIEALLAQAGKVFFLGPLPQYDQDGNDLSGWRQRVAGHKDRVRVYPDPGTAPADVAESLARTESARLRLAPGLSAGIVMQSRKIRGDEIYFLANLSSSHLRIPSFLRTAKAGVDLFFPWTGRARKLPFARKGNGLSFSLDFAPLESLFLAASDHSTPSWIEETDLAIIEYDDEKLSGFYSPQGASLKVGGEERDLPVAASTPEPISISGPFEFEPLSPNLLRLGPWRVKTDRPKPLPRVGLKDEFTFSGRARLLVRLLGPLVAAANFLLRPETKYRGLVYQDFGDIETELERASGLLGIDFQRMGLYQTIDALFRFADYLPLRTDFRVYPPLGAFYRAETTFKLDFIPPQLELVYEDLGQPVDLAINGRELKAAPRPERVWDDSNRVLEISGRVRRGKNHLRFSSRQLGFPCLFPSFHTLEPVVLRGAFEVDKKGKVTAASLRKSFGDLCRLGYPNYAGKVKYGFEFELAPELLDRHLLLECGDLREQVEALVNGRPAGVRIGLPYQFVITGLAQAGKNKVELIVSNTAANLLSVPEPWGLLGRVMIWPFYKFAKTRSELLSPAPPDS